MTLAYTFSELLSVPEDVLAQQMVKIKDDKGNIVLDAIDDHELAPIAEQDIVREKILAASKKARAISYLDPNQLSRRLTEAAGRAEGPPADERTSEDAHVSRRPTKSPPPLIGKKDDEVMGFIDLVRLGGRPACNLDMLRAIRENPQSYPEIIEPWRLELEIKLPQHSDIRLFSEQLSRWKSFRVWQHNSRGLDLPPELDSFRQSQFFHQDPSPMSSSHDASKRKAKEQYRSLILSRCIEAERANHASGLPAYADATQSRLRRHGIHRPFSPHTNPRDQSKLYTWLEYIAFEVWLLDTNATALRPHDAPLENMSKSKPNSDSSIQAQPCDRHEASSQTINSLSAKNESETEKLAKQEILHNEVARSQRVLDWAIVELRNVDVKARPDTEISEPLISQTPPSKKRKRGDEADTGSPSPSTITPAPSFRQEAQPDDKKRSRTDISPQREVGRAKVPEPVQAPSPIISPTSVDENWEESE